MGCTESKVDTKVKKGPYPISDSSLKDISKEDEMIRDQLLNYDNDTLKQRNILFFGPSRSGKNVFPFALKIIKASKDNLSTAKDFWDSQNSPQTEQDQKNFIATFIKETLNCLLTIMAVADRDNSITIPNDPRKILNSLKNVDVPFTKSQITNLGKAVNSFLADTNLQNAIEKKQKQIPLGSCKLDSLKFFLQNFSNIVINQDWKAIRPSDLLHFLPESQKKQTQVYIEQLSVNLIQGEEIRTETNYKDWKEQITSIDALLFTVPLSDFDHHEDIGFKQTLQFYSLLASGRTVASIPWIILFSKKDLFLKKLEKNPEDFEKIFPEFSKEKDEIEDIGKEALSFLTKKFQDLNHLNSKKVLFLSINIHDLSDVKSACSEISDFLPNDSAKKEKKNRRKKGKLLEKEGNTKKDQDKNKKSQDKSKEKGNEDTKKEALPSKNEKKGSNN